MTTPNDPLWSGNPGSEPGGWQPPQYGEPYSQPPQYGPPPQSGPPQYEPTYGPPAQHGPEELLGPPEPPRRGVRGKTLAIASAVVVVLGGGIATYAAVTTSSGASGSGTPQQAVQKIFTDLGRSDLLGMLDDLPPAERDAMAKPLQDTVTALQHEGILAPNANLNDVSGVQIQASNLTFAPNTITINDHVQVVRLTGGTITFDADATKLPLAGGLLRQIAAGGSSNTVHQTANIAKEVRRTGQPIRIATQKVGGRWYPSLLYTIADNAATKAGLGTPGPADAIPARGASSPDAAARQMVTDLLAGRVEQAIELASPDEDAVLHDYGKFIVDHVHYPPAPVQINSIGFTDTAISGGTLVSVKSITATIHGRQVSVNRQGGCVEFRGIGQDKRLCRGDMSRILHSQGIRGPAAEQLLTSETSVGIVTTKSGGKWYVNPLRTIVDLMPQLVPLFAVGLHAATGVPLGGGGSHLLPPIPGFPPTR